MKSGKPTAGERMIESARQALAFAKGKGDHGCEVHVPDDIDVKAIRERISLSQGEFAKLFGLSKRTLEHWEHGRRVPSGAARAFLLTENTTAIAGRLADSTPQPQEVRVAGQLDMIRRSTRSFGLQLDDGTEVHGVLENADEVDQMREFFGQRVLVLGRAIYRPSGSLLRIDAHAIEHGEGQPSIFSRVPPSRSRRIPQVRKVTAGQGWDSFSSYFGCWPGDETDDQWNEMMLELKK